METNFKPDYAIHVGVFLKEELESLKITQKKLSELTHISETIISEIINGKRRINSEIAIKLEKVLYSPASYWLNLQSIYDEAEARLKLGIPKTELITTINWNISKETLNVVYENKYSDLRGIA